MVEVALNMEMLKIWWFKSPKPLKKAQSDGWNFRKHRTTQNLIVEVA